MTKMRGWLTDFCLLWSELLSQGSLGATRVVCPFRTIASLDVFRTSRESAVNVASTHAEHEKDIVVCSVLLLHAVLVATGDHHAGLTSCFDPCTCPTLGRIVWNRRQGGQRESSRGQWTAHTRDVRTWRRAGCHSLMCRHPLSAPSLFLWAEFWRIFLLNLTTPSPHTLRHHKHA